MIEEKLKADSHIVGFFSCGTVLPQKVDGKEDDVPGMAIWVMFDWPGYGLSAFENYLSRLIIKIGLDLLSCKAVHRRSKFKFFLVVLLHLIK